MQIKINPNGPTGISITPDGKVSELKSWDDVREGNDERPTLLIEVFEGGSPGGGHRAVFTKLGRAWEKFNKQQRERGGKR